MARPKLSVVSTASLQAELQRRVAKLGDLVAQRDALDQQIAELQGMVVQAPEAPQAAPKVGKKRGRKPGRKPKAVRATGKPLGEYVKEILAAAPQGLGLKDIEKAVLAAEYPTRAKTLYTPIMKVLGKIGAKKVGRGVYAMRGKPGRKPAAKAPAPAAPAPEKPEAPAKRQKYAQTGEEFVLGLFEGGKGLTVGEIADAWTKEGRGGKADNTLTKLVKEGKLKRESVEGQRRSRYSLA